MAFRQSGDDACAYDDGGGELTFVFSPVQCRQKLAISQPIHHNDRHLSLQMIRRGYLECSAHSHSLVSYHIWKIHL